MAESASSRSYSELIQMPTFSERIEYLKLHGVIAQETFGSERWLNQHFYTSPEWKRLRRDVIIRDMGCDLGVENFEIPGSIIVHHLNPITIDDIRNQNFDKILNPENLICTSLQTHNYIHYGYTTPEHISLGRKPNDTCPWKGGEFWSNSDGKPIKMTTLANEIDITNQTHWQRKPDKLGMNKKEGHEQHTKRC